MLNRARACIQLVVAVALGLSVLVASSASVAGFTIAPFTLNTKRKIYTFVYPTSSGGTFSCAACYIPRAVYSSPTGTENGGYFYAPTSVVGSGPAFFINPRTAAHQSPSFGYYVNPYWGAQHAPGITTSFGKHPYTPLSPNTAVLAGTPNPQAGPDFSVHPSQAGLAGITGMFSLGPGGNYLATVSGFEGTNGTFALGSGAGPGTTTFTAPASWSSAGKVKFIRGHDHENGFGGTMDWLGGTTGFYPSKTSHGTTAKCTGPYDGNAILCYYQVPFAFPINAAHGNADENHWADSPIVELRSRSPGGNVFATPSGVVTTAYTTFKVTTGQVIMSQPDASAFTLHTFHGSDERTPLGAGNLTLVSGWLGHTIADSAVSHWGGTTVSKFHFPAVPSTPSLANSSLGALGGLMALAAVYVIRKRRSGNEG